MKIKASYIYQRQNAVRTDLIEKEIEVPSMEDAMETAQDLWFLMCKENKNLKLNSIKAIKTAKL